jgi:hypothetical protein
MERAEELGRAKETIPWVSSSYSPGATINLMLLRPLAG